MSPKAVLVGLPGSGKSTIGRRLAKALGVNVYDTDIGIEAAAGRTIADIFASDGEPEFRRIEEQVIRQALAEQDGVVSLGGGAVLTPGVRDALSGHTVVYLEISAAEGIRRTGGSVVRPLLAGPDRAEKYHALMNQRVPLYRQVSTVKVNTDRRNPGAVVRMIVTRLENPDAPVPSRRRRPRRRPRSRRGSRGAAAPQTPSTNQESSGND